MGGAGWLCERVSVWWEAAGGSVLLQRHCQQRQAGGIQSGDSRTASCTACAGLARKGTRRPAARYLGRLSPCARPDWLCPDFAGAPLATASSPLKAHLPVHQWPAFACTTPRPLAQAAQFGGRPTPVAPDSITGMARCAALPSATQRVTSWPGAASYSAPAQNGGGDTQLRGRVIATHRERLGALAGRLRARRRPHARPSPWPEARAQKPGFARLEEQQRRGEEQVKYTGRRQGNQTSTAATRPRNDTGQARRHDGIKG